MSYCRFIEADVYVYDCGSGYFTCADCTLRAGVAFDTTFRTAMIAHLRQHEAVGDRTGSAIERLEQEIASLGDEWGDP